MNNIRRKQLDLIIERIAALIADVEFLVEEEQSYFDNMPEGIQCSEKGNRAEENINNLDMAVTSFEEVIEYINEALL